MTVEFSSAAAFYDRFPQYADGHRSPDRLPAGAAPFGSDERSVHDSAGRKWSIVLVAAAVVFRFGRERYRSEPGHASGAVVAHRARDLYDQFPAVTRLLVDRVDLYDALECVNAEPRPSLEELTKQLAHTGEPPRCVRRPSSLRLQRFLGPGGERSEPARPALG